MWSFTNYQNADAVCGKLLSVLSINIAPEKIISELEKHPEYPSLLAISDVLNTFHINNAAYRVEHDQLITVPTPFIAHTNLNNGDFVMVNKMDGDNVSVSNAKWDRHKINLDEFKNMFAGVVLTAEPSVATNITPTTFTTILISVKFPLTITGMLLIFIAALSFHTDYFVNYTWQILLLTTFKSAGLVASILLLIQSINRNNQFVQKLCQSKSKTNCNAILSSKAAIVFEGLTWSEVGFFYFAGTWLILLFCGHSTSMLWVLAILNFVSLPYTFYSIYYQIIVAKQWCVLCCTVQALLWLEFIPSITVLDSSFTLPNAIEWSALFIALLLPVILWASLKPMLLKIQQLKPLKEQLRKFKYNTQLFSNLLKDQIQYTLPDEEWSIVFGNIEANNSITMVTNPYCPPCSKMHKVLDELLDEGGDIQARIVFTANNTDEDIKTPVSRHLMALNELPDKTIVKRALNDWYGQKQKNYEAWAKVYPVQLNEAEFYKIDKQNAWCKMVEVTATPTLLLNGYRLPDLYQLADLKYMLE